jgi:multicomponent Na+:H+ antiporter subunit E
MKIMGKGFGFLITFFLMLLFWLLLSGQFSSPFHLVSGLISSALVAFLSHDLLVKGRSDKLLIKFWRFLCYIPWELWQIVLANIDVAYRVLHPKMPIDPLVFEFETPFREDWALTTLANSITLTPGTITIDVEPEKGKFQVHAIAKEFAEALLVDQTMQRKVADIFMESDQKEGLR